ncbi:MAG: N-6 DNA methylase [Micrococcaceae bacterium]
MVKGKKSVEPKIAERGNGWLKAYALDYELEQGDLGNTEIDNALKEYKSKSGGSGSNRPDAKLFIEDSQGNAYPVMIEYKGHKGKLAKFNKDGTLANTKADASSNYANIMGYAVNGAVHYANAILQLTTFDKVIAIGMTGYEDHAGVLQCEIGVYFVSSKDNYGEGQKIGEYTDFSFLAKENREDFFNKIQDLQLTDVERENIKRKKEEEIDISLSKLNNDIYKNETGLSEQDRVYLVCAVIIATLKTENVTPLTSDKLESSLEPENTDGHIIMRKVKNFLNTKNLPKSKLNLIVRSLENTLLTEHLNTVVNKETPLKRIFNRIVDDLGIYYNIGLTTDFTGKLFNEMYSWLGFSQDKLNDVVLTPAPVATLLCKLARVNKDSYVWDFATGSAGLLVSAMNIMLDDAKENINSPEELAVKETRIKAQQLLGLEILPSIYMLAVLNMILMGDGSSNILNEDSMQFNGKYGFTNVEEEFPADAFILNPPYSAEGKGMVFVDKALSMMNKGYASVIIQNSAGSGQAKELNKRILKDNTLLASIKMPIDLFVGKSSVQTYIYVFKVGEKHDKDSFVHFIDFSNDGYTRAARKKSKSSVNLRDTDNAKERYEEVVKIINHGSGHRKLLSEQEHFEGLIDPNDGADWNQKSEADNKPTVDDFKKTVSDFLAWEVSNLLKNSGDDTKGKQLAPLQHKFDSAKWSKYKISDLFEKVDVKKVPYKKGNLPDVPNDIFQIPAITSSSSNNGIAGYVPSSEATVLEGLITIAANGNAPIFYQSGKFTILQDAYALRLKKELYAGNEKHYIYLASAIAKALDKYNWNNKSGWNKVKNDTIVLPVKNGEIDFEFMEERIRELEAERIRELEAYLIATGLNDYVLTEDEQVR